MSFGIVSTKSVDMTSSKFWWPQFGTDSFLSSEKLEEGDLD